MPVEVRFSRAGTTTQALHGVIAAPGPFTFAALRMELVPQEDEAACSSFEEVRTTCICRLMSLTVHLSVFYSLKTDVIGKVRVGGSPVSPALLRHALFLCSALN